MNAQTEANDTEIGGLDDLEAARRKRFPAYAVAAENVDYWKQREALATERKETAKGWLSRVFWHIQLLSAVGNGAEAERCRDSLMDPHWGIMNSEPDAGTVQEACELGIRRHNARHRGFDHNC